MRKHVVLLAAACATAEATPVKLAAIGSESMCVTKGRIASQRITEPTVRAVAVTSSGDGAALTFVFRGDSARTRELANGDARRQLGLKLRAANGCNLVYVMWRLDPHPRLEVSVKWNPGMATHKECGAEGYTKIKPARHAPVPALVAGASHTLHAEIAGDVLAAWIDGSLAWVGELPDDARDMTGPAGIRSDNVAFDIRRLSAVALVTTASCHRARTNTAV